MAKEIAQQLNADPEIIFEGQEKKHFWDVLGGKEPYFDEKVFKQSELFQIDFSCFVLSAHHTNT